MISIDRPPTVSGRRIEGADGSKGAHLSLLQSCQGLFENSPAFQRWVERKRCRVPAGTAERRAFFFRPSRDLLSPLPPPTDKSVGYFRSSLRACNKLRCVRSKGRWKKRLDNGLLRGQRCGDINIPTGVQSVIYTVRRLRARAVKRKFTVILAQGGDHFVARCPDVPDAVASGSSKEDALDKMRALLIKRFGDDSDSGSAPTPHPPSPPPRGPRGPLVAQIELPDDNAA